MAPAPVLVRGGGELSSAAARLLFLSGYPVAILERPEPLAVRRKVSFAQALFAEETVVEGVRGRRVPLDQIAPGHAFVAVAVDPEGESIDRLRPAVLVDGRMLKRNEGTTRAQATLVVGLGPGFIAGDDVHAVVETQRGPSLGRVLWSGRAEADSAHPARVLGYADERVLRAPRGGRFQGRVRIGDVVTPGQTLGEVEGEPVVASIAGLVRGLVADGVRVEPAVKIGDIDPRGLSVAADRISDKARAVAAGVLEAVLVSLLPR